MLQRREPSKELSVSSLILKQKLPVAPRITDSHQMVYFFAAYAYFGIFVLLRNNRYF